jgi:hypothetical protein
MFSSVSVLVKTTLDEGFHLTSRCATAILFVLIFQSTILEGACQRAGAVDIFSM